MSSKATSSSTHKKDKGNNVLFPLFMSVMVGIIVMVITTMICAFIWSMVDLPMILPVFTYLAVALGSATAGIVTAVAFRKEKLMMCAICGVILALLLAVINLIFFRAPTTTLSLIKYAVAFGVPILVSFFVKENKKRRYKR